MSGIYFEVSVKDYQKMLTTSEKIGNEKDNLQTNHSIDIDEGIG